MLLFYIRVKLAWFYSHVLNVCVSCCGDKWFKSQDRISRRVRTPECDFMISLVLPSNIWKAHSAALGSCLSVCNVVIDTWYLFRYHGKSTWNRIIWKSYCRSVFFFLCLILGLFVTVKCQYCIVLNTWYQKIINTLTNLISCMKVIQQFYINHIIKTKKGFLFVSTWEINDAVTGSGICSLLF